MRFALKLALSAVLAKVIQAELTQILLKPNDNFAIHQSQGALYEEEQVRKI